MIFLAGGARNHHVTIGAFHYLLRFQEHIVDGGHSLYGQHDPAELRLVIDSKTSPQRQVATVLHEVVHAASSQSNLELTEAQVDVLSYQWLSFMRDNPGMVDEMMEVLA